MIRDKEEPPAWFSCLFYFLLIAFIVVGVGYGMITLNQYLAIQEANKQVCLEAGYPEYRYVNETAYCVGMKDGQSIVVKMEE